MKTGVLPIGWKRSIVLVRVRPPYERLPILGTAWAYDWSFAKPEGVCDARRAALYEIKKHIRSCQPPTGLATRWHGITETAYLSGSWRRPQLRTKSAAPASAGSWSSSCMGDWEESPRRRVGILSAYPLLATFGKEDPTSVKITLSPKCAGGQHVVRRVRAPREASELRRAADQLRDPDAGQLHCR